MKYKKYLITIIGLVACLAVYNYAAVSKSLIIAEQMPPLCINGYCEPQVRLNCKASKIKLRPCQQISENLWRWINSHGVLAIKAGYKAAGYKDPVNSAVIYCNRGIYNRKKIGNKRNSRKRWSQHSFRRACDGNKIQVNGVIFTYKGSGVKRPKTKSDKFFITFLDNWGTVGLGYKVQSTLYLMDFNRGVRDCREDSRHCYHYHISKPCYTCLFTGSMGYE